jgi:predicted hydrocarbon binding protein
VKLHERLHFDTDRGQVLDGPRRYVLLRADVLMGLFDALPDATRDQALRSFAGAVTRFGADSVRAYATGVGRAQLLATMQDAAASLGWGTWRFESAADDILRLEVQNSPFAAGTTRRDAPACAPVTGMLRAVADALWPGGAHAEERSCAAQCGREVHLCRFEARRGSSHPTITHKESDS